MKFDDLFNRVFVSEQNDETEEVLSTSDIADPSDVEVEPAPLPEPALATDTTGDANTTSSASPNNIGGFVSELEEFANKLNGTETSSLQSLVSQLDRPGTPFDGISARTRTEIVRVAETLRSISENLKSFMINAAKK